MQAAAEELAALGGLPFAGFCSDPCDGRTQGTPGMMDSLPYRNDAAHGAAAADPLAAHAAGRARRRHVRQGPARDDDGAGRAARPALRAGARRRDAAADRGRGRGQGADDRRPLRPRRDHAGGGGRPGLPRLRLARRRLPVPRHGGHVAGRRRGARPVAAALRARALRAADLARHGPPLGPRAASARGARPDHARHPHRRRGAQRHDGARGVRRLDESAAAHPRDRPRRRAAPPDGARTGSTSTAACRAWSTCCRTGPATIRPCASSWPAACPR